MSDIYDQHRVAFANVSAYVISKNGNHVASIAFKHPKDGAGRLYAYVHFFGTAMVRAHASGCGYDKQSAAVTGAVHKIATAADAPNPKLWPEFSAALWSSDGVRWNNSLARAGFDVWCAV